MVHFVGAGPGAADLITLRAKALLEGADAVIYAGSLVNPALLSYTKPDCEKYDSALMTLDEVIAVMERSRVKSVVRLHSGDPSLYGAIQEQMDRLDALFIPYDICPGVSSLCGAAAALGIEYTLPGVSQSVVITRMAGRTDVPKRESIASFASHGATMVVFLSAGLLEALAVELLRGGFAPDAPAAIVYKATWPEEKVLRCCVSTLASTAKEHGISNTALIVVGGCLKGEYELSRLYAAEFSTAYRKAKQ